MTVLGMTAGGREYMRWLCGLSRWNLPIQSFSVHTTRLRDANIAPGGYGHMLLIIFFCEVCVLFLYCVLRDESLSISSIIFERILSLSLIRILYAYLTSIVGHKIFFPSSSYGLYPERSPL
jgi:hypothetical protein